MRQLGTQVKTQAAHLRHAEYFMNVLAESKRLYKLGNENILTGLALFDRERTNIETGQAWTAAHPQDPAAAKLCNLYPNAGAYVLDLRLHPQEQITWLEAALEAARVLGNREYEGVHLGNLGIA